MAKNKNASFMIAELIVFEIYENNTQNIKKSAQKNGRIFYNNARSHRTPVKHDNFYLFKENGFSISYDVKKLGCRAIRGQKILRYRVE